MSEEQILQLNENDNDSDDYSVTDDEIRCTKLPLAENIASYIEKRELCRDIEAVTCNSNLLEEVMCNYVIAKKIISGLSWQDKMLCKHVCSMWHSVIHTLQKEQLYPADFVINLRISSIRNGIKFMKSSNFYTEPLVVFTFANSSGFSITSKCEVLVPSPCEPPCDKEHHLVDVINQQVAAPKNCMLTVKASFLSYMPLPTSITSEHILTHQMFIRSNPFIGGVYIPKIPGVEFHIMNIKDDTQKDFYEPVSKLVQDRIIKGVLVYVTDSYLMHSVEDIIFLNYFKDVQPDVPYALGGCIVEDTLTKQKDINLILDGLNEGKDYISEDLITIGIFTVPKNGSTDGTHQEHGCNFEAYSLITESSDWAKAKIQRTINEFSKKVPHFEHSVVLKLSCIGRDQKHELEQDYFRAAFPNTRLVGCYGNGELGVNHPARPPDDAQNTAKRHRRDPGPQFGIMYSYSTVFFYIGWGKMLSPPEVN